MDHSSITNTTPSIPSLREIVYVAPQPNWSFPLHTHDTSAELSLVLNGQGTFYAYNKEHLIKRGMLVVKNPGVSHSEKSDPDAPLEQICIEIDSIGIEGLPENHVIPSYMDPPIELGQDLELITGTFRYLMENYKDPSKAVICGKLLDVTLDIIQEKVKIYVPLRERKPKNKKELISEALQYLDTNYRSKLRIKDLAYMFYTSEGNMSRQFKAVTGYTINEYIISKRMREAQRQLIYENNDIKDVARSCGHNDIQYFYHVFKSYAHCTPAEFRAKYQ